MQKHGLTEEYVAPTQEEILQAKVELIDKFSEEND